MGVVFEAGWIQWITAGECSMTEADRTITNLMILRIMSTTNGRISVKQIFDEIQPNMGISIRSLQRYLNGLANWGLVEKDGQTPQGFRLSQLAKELFADIALGKSE